MILKLTFNDNDFTQLLKEMIDNWILDYNNIYWVLKRLEPEMVGIFELIWYHIQQEDTLNKENTNLFIKIIKKVIMEYLYTREWDSIDTLTYLEKSLEIKLISNCKNKWKNGEVIYYFLHNANQYIIC